MFALKCLNISPSIQPRITIPLFRYAGTDVGEASNHFTRFQSIIQRKLTTLSGEAQYSYAHEQSSPQARTQQLGYLGKLSLSFPREGPQPDNLRTLLQREDFWKNQNALLLFRGELWTDKTKPYVLSDIYLGDLRGSFPAQEVRVKLSIQPESVPKTLDSHSLIIYYALAMDARRLGCDPAIVNALLAKARSILSDLRNRPGSLQGDLELFDRLLSGNPSNALIGP